MMAKQQFDTPGFVAKQLDTDFSFSPRDILTKFLLRWRLFALCILMAPLVALGLTYLVPLNFKSTAKILIRHEGGATSYFRDVTTGSSAMSAGSTAEILRGIPVCSRMVEKVGIESKDVARPAYKVLFGYVVRYITPLLGKEKEDGPPNPQLETQRLAQDLKDSIETKSLAGGQIGIQKHDEMVSVTVESTNRYKVDQMANEICEAYIALYNEQSEALAMLAYHTLEEQYNRVRADLDSIRQSSDELIGTDTASAAENVPEDYQGSDANVHTKPLAEGLARQVSDLQLKLSKLRQTFREETPEVQKAHAELERARTSLARQESMDSARSLLSLIKRKQREALLAAQLYRSKESDVSIIERAIPPKVTKFAILMHYGVPVASALAGGIFIGGILVLLLGAFDPRIQTTADVQGATDLPVLATLKLDMPRSGIVDQLAQLPKNESLSTWLHLTGKLEGSGQGRCGTVLVTSAEQSATAGTGAVALNLAALLSHDPSVTVLLLDADPQERSLTTVLGYAKKKGLIELLRDPAGADDISKLKDSNLHFLAAGQLADIRELAFIRAEWETLHARLAIRFNVIIIHSPGILDSREPMMLGARADQSILVAITGSSDKQKLAQAEKEVQSIKALPLGVLLLR